MHDVLVIGISVVAVLGAVFALAAAKAARRADDLAEKLRHEERWDYRGSPMS